jgi:hypothetical protein
MEATLVPKGMHLNADGYLRIHKSGPLRDKMAHRAYMERCVGRSLRQDEEVHHLCRNRACWPPTDFHLLLLDERLHHAIDAGSEPRRKYRRKVNRHFAEVVSDIT